MYKIKSPEQGIIKTGVWGIVCCIEKLNFCTLNKIDMKKRILFCIALYLAVAAPFFIAAQNVGIGNTNPQYKLDMSGRLRIRGGSNNFSSAGLWLAGTGTDSASDKAFMGMANDSTIGLFGNTGAGWALTMNGNNGQVGIGNSLPDYPLSFANLSGDKISLFRDDNGSYYGMGVGSATLQLTTPHNTSDILFGYGKSSSFTENMRLKGNGFLGIGVNDPVYRLDVKDRMRLRSGGDANSSPGIFLNNLNNTGVASFIGMQSDNTVGFWGNSNVWGLTMNTQNGNVGISNTSPHAPLQFANDIKNRKIVLYETGNNDHQFYGLGVTSSVLRYQTATTGDDHVFYAGSGTSSSNELMRVKGNGYMGVGVADPQFRLDLKDRIRIRSGGDNNTSAGIYFNNNANSSLTSFVGMQTDTTAGLWGNGTGWGLTMNTQNGALAVGGSTGNAGQVLASNGSTAAPGWTAAGNIIRTEFAGVFSQQYNITGNNFIELTNSAYDVTLAYPSRVILFCKTLTEAYSLFPIGDAESRWRLELWLNGSVSRTYRINGYKKGSLSGFDNKLDLTTGPEYFDLPAGTHHFTFFAANLLGSSIIAMQVTSMIIPI